jgi:hypothetical protein
MESPMHRLAFVLLLTAVPAFAEEKAKPNRLTQKEIADGWILLFDGETTFGWKAEGEAAVKDGVLVLGGERASRVESTGTLDAIELQFEYSSDNVSWHLINARRPKGGSLFAYADASAPPLPFESKWPEDPKRLGIEFKAREKQPVYLRSIRLRPSAMTMLFNGKDLSGWKVYDPAKAKAADPKAKEVAVKSQYTVTKEGWLNVKDGPGDLQSEGQWADFVVQLECISNGKHLNSGLFFRCLPDLYQQGYEAQIRNEWTGDDRNKPVDFGTGAIYRRQAARKVVSTDGEWFTMTVAAHGRHFATWVNGYQVTDWTDDRKESDNARNGFKKGKGALSIQGHDPTTDLSFRNIRIQSLDPK